MPKHRQSDLEFCFKERTLSIYQSGQEVRRITAWPNPAAEDLKADGTRKRICPVFRFLSKPLRTSKNRVDNQLELILDIDPTPNSDKCSKKVAYDRLRQSIPDEYSSRLAAFYSHQWNPLRFLSINGDFLELLVSNPPLAYFLANHSGISERVFCDVLKIDDLIRMPQTVLMKMLRLPNTKQAVKLMRKLAPESASPDNLALIKNILESQERLKQIVHLQRINTGVLHLLNLDPYLLKDLTPKFLTSVANDPKSRFSRQAATEFKETVTAHNRLYAHRQQNLNIRSLEQLLTLHTDILNSHTEQLDEKHAGTFPSPPIQGNRKIVPIKAAKALVMEGIAMHNCVGNRKYADAVRAGEKYIYAVKEPQRATLSIMPGAGGTWFISELYTACNRQVNRATREVVEE
jgi:hypothetical protein